MTVTRRLCEKIACDDRRQIGETAIAKARQLVLDGDRRRGRRRTHRGSAAHPRRLSARAGIEAGVFGAGFRFSPRAGSGRAAQCDVDACARFRADVDAGDARAVARARAGAGARGIDRRRRSRGSCRRHQGRRNPGLDSPRLRTRRVARFQVSSARHGGADRRGGCGVASAASSTPRRLANAIGIATSRCGSLTSNTGTMTKSTHCGYAASLGLESALLAASGFTGDEEAFDSPRGYAATFLPPHFDREMLMSFGPPFRLVDPGLHAQDLSRASSRRTTASPRPSRRGRGLPSPDAIRAVRMLAPVVPTGDRPHPRTGLEGKFSVQYTLAAALLDGAVTLSSFTDERLHRPDMQTLLEQDRRHHDAGYHHRIQCRPLRRSRNRTRRRQRSCASAASGRAAPGVRSRSRRPSTS